MTTTKQNIRLTISVAMLCAKRQGYIIAATMTEGMIFGLLATSFITHQAYAADSVAQSSNASHSLSVHQGTTATATTKSNPVVTHRPGLANFGHESSSEDVRHMADWVVDSGDNRSLPFVIVDKKNAKVFVFNADGRLLGAASALLGLAQGDDSVPGIGDQKLSDIRPDERTTPAGRFVAVLDRNLHGQQVLWVDYRDAISLHPVITTNPKERREQRLATPSPLDNRISYGCINVPLQFYRRVVSPTFTSTNGIVYVLPETRPIQKTFPLYDDIDEREQRQIESQPLPEQATSRTDANVKGQ